MIEYSVLDVLLSDSLCSQGLKNIQTRLHVLAQLQPLPLRARGNLIHNIFTLLLLFLLLLRLRSRGDVGEVWSAVSLFPRRVHIPIVFPLSILLQLRQHSKGSASIRKKGSGIRLFIRAHSLGKCKGGWYVSCGAICFLF